MPLSQSGEVIQGAPSGSVERSWATLDLDHSHSQATGGSIRPVLLRYRTCKLRC